MDGKTLAGDQLVIALCVTTPGEKRILGLVQTATENKRACASFLREIEERGFRAPNRLLAVLDEAKGLRAAVKDVFGENVEIQRFRRHKRENVLSYLLKSDQPIWKRKIKVAYRHRMYADAKKGLLRRVKDLALVNESAARSLEEGPEAARLGDLPRAGGEFPDDEPDRERDGETRGEDPAREQLEDERSEVALVRRCVARRGEELPPSEGLQAAALAREGACSKDEDHERGCRLSSHHCDRSPLSTERRARLDRRRHGLAACRTYPIYIAF
jgi:hypothetical protein